ncbi:MAG TPA: hypothetical protein VG015_06535, partial [Candidatus Dormibacteraeota bacterium]|nr:hypothetical protein [Candidatus Dormibacteraeota bacterium]
MTAIAIQSGDDPAGIPLGVWPEIPDHIADLARMLAERIRNNRSVQDLRSSVRSEERLYETVCEIVDLAVTKPGDFGLNAGIAHRLSHEATFQAEVVKATMVLASWLYPLSRIIYLLEGLEEIHIYRWDHWIVTGRGIKIMLGEAGNPFGNDERVLSF